LKKGGKNWKPVNAAVAGFKMKGIAANSSSITTFETTSFVSSE